MEFEVESLDSEDYSLSDEGHELSDEDDEVGFCVCQPFSKMKRPSIQSLWKVLLFHLFKIEYCFVDLR